MNDLREFLKNGIIITDGASGTYIPSLTGRNASLCELLNLNNPEVVLRMHRQYVNAGAKLIFTNTFSASIAGGSIGGSFSTTRKIISEGVRLACLAADGSAFVAADIGPLPETSLGSDVLGKEYRRIADAFIDAGMTNFVFETFAAAGYPVKVSQYIKSRLPDAFILISFAVMPDGYSREGVSGSRLIGEVKSAGCADAAGFNCCSGPSHLLNFAATVDYGGLIPVIMPNAGYPQRESDDAEPLNAGISYSGSPEYFAAKLSLAAGSGFRIIGGCCGTTPRHIAMLSQAVASVGRHAAQTCETQKKAAFRNAQANTFFAALNNPDKKAVIVELEPPLAADISRLESAARLLKDIGVDAVTVADSPMARARADSVAVAAHLRRETGVEVIPHICCRDKNINAIKSSLIAAHIEGIRNILAVTGDPVPDTDRGSVKSVFNLNSEGLCRFLKSLNGDIFKGDEMLCGCAFNVNARNLPTEFSRLEKKLAAGASFVLTQPVFTPEAAAAVAAIHKSGARVLAGILTPVSYKNAVFLANEMPGFKIPDEYVQRFSKDMTRGQGEDAGIAISVQIAETVADAVDGFYFIVPFNRVGVTQRVIDTLRKNSII
jgi:methionine synthase / methylenetetrahydrofolate reductase(NADPH)